MKKRRIVKFMVTAAMMLLAAGAVQAQEETSTENIVTMENQTLGLSGITNARQLGGYITEDGMRVKDNVLLRSGKLADAAEGDLDILCRDYHLTEVIDFRTTAEIEAEPDPELTGCERVEIRILDENDTASNGNAAIAGIYNKQSDNPAEALLELYRAGVLSEDMYSSMLDDETALKGYRTFLDELLAHEDGAILWHCTGGKDRAGMAAVIILTLLGVDKETVLEDFALTNTFNQERIEYMVSSAKLLTEDQEELSGVAALVGVSRSNMEKVFEIAEAESGSLFAYIQEKLQVTDEEIAALREKYLEAAEA